MKKKPLKSFKKEKTEIWIHPEQRKDEKFIVNANENAWEKIKWRTKRKGKKSFHITTNEPLDSGLFPVFIKKQEYDDYIQGKFDMTDLEKEKKGSLVKKKLKRGSYKLEKDVTVFID